MGAWIEISALSDFDNISSVAPFMGAWIEIALTDTDLQARVRRTLYGCVD